MKITLDTKQTLTFPSCYVIFFQVEASKTLVNEVNTLVEATREIMGKTGHEQPKALANQSLLHSRDLIAKAKAYHISLRAEEEAEVCRGKLIVFSVSHLNLDQYLHKQNLNRVGIFVGEGCHFGT